MTREQLKRIMRKHLWTMDHVAQLTDSSIHSVRAWLRPSTSVASRTMKKQTADAIIMASKDLTFLAARKKAAAGGR